MKKNKITDTRSAAHSSSVYRGGGSRRLTEELNLLSLLLLITLLLPALAACTDSTLPDDADGNGTSALPGTATPEGGDQPGVTLTLDNPVIAISGINATAKTKAAPGTREATTPTISTGDIDADDIRNITLDVDLMTADGNVTQSSAYTYRKVNGSGKIWTVKSSYSPLIVRGGTGHYYMRATASVQLTSGRSFNVCYTGTAKVEQDLSAIGTAATFTFGGSMKPYASAVNVALKDADGKVLDASSGYWVYLRGMATIIADFNEDNSIIWTEGEDTHPKYSTDGYYSKDNDGAFTDVMPGIVPAQWKFDEHDYLSTTPNTSDPDILGDGLTLFSIYKEPNGFGSLDSPDETHGLPTNASASYHVKMPADPATGLPAKTYTLAPGKAYTFTLTLNGDKTATISSIEVSDFEDAKKEDGNDDIIEIG